MCVYKLVHHSQNRSEFPWQKSRDALSWQMFTSTYLANGAHPSGVGDTRKNDIRGSLSLFATSNLYITIHPDRIDHVYSCHDWSRSPSDCPSPTSHCSCSNENESHLGAADLLHDGPYTVGYPSSSLQSLNDTQFLRPSTLNHQKKSQTATRQNRTFHHRNGRSEIHHDLLRHRLGAPDPALRSQSVESAVRHNNAPSSLHSFGD